MNEKSTSNNKDIEFTTNSEKGDYSKLINKLKKISETIGLLEKTIL